jgi:hypothetical protein
MTDIKTITLAGADYDIETPLTIGEIIDLKVAVSLPSTGDDDEDARRNHMRMVRAISAALKPKYPDMSVEKILSIRSTNEEYVTAGNAVLELSGLVPKAKDPTAGEAKAGAE